MRLNAESQESIHFGINFICFPAPSLDHAKVLAFQQNVAAEGTEFPSANLKPNVLELSRQDPPLSASVGIVGPGIAQLLIRAENPKRSLDLFAKEVTSVCGAYKKTWGSPKQFLTRDAAIHCLYVCTDCNHSFKFLWEHLLNQGAEDARLLSKPILGGGLRFVMPPSPSDTPEPIAVEVKLESFMQDPARLLVIAHCVWPSPSNQDMFAKAPELLERVKNYINQSIVPFLSHKKEKT